MNKGYFQCGICNLYEEGLSDDEILRLSTYHYEGKHIDIDELRRIKSLKEKKNE
jgi:hypothetical protein